MQQSNESCNLYINYVYAFGFIFFPVNSSSFFPFLNLNIPNCISQRLGKLISFLS